MDFELSMPLQRLREEVDSFAAARLADGESARLAGPAFPSDAMALLAARGWSGLAATAPGSGGGVLAAVVAVEALARTCPRSADALHLLNFGAALLLARHAEAPPHRALLQAILGGEKIVALAITEDDAGAQASAIRSCVVGETDALRLHGHKKYTANSVEADAFIVYARFGGTVEDIGAVIVDRGQVGLVPGEPERFMSGELWCRLEFGPVRLDPADVLFRGGGFTSRGGFFELERLGHAARALGLGWCAWDLAGRHAADRRQFGRALCEFQGLQWKFAEARLALEVAQLTLYRAAARADRDVLGGDDACAAKVLCNRAASAAGDLAVQVAGGAGYSAGHRAEYCFRKARGYRLNGGIEELMLTRIAEGTFGRKFPQHGV